MVKHQTLSDLQKQTVQPVIREQQLCLLSALLSCISRLHLIIMVIMIFCSFERTDIIQVSYITFYYNRFSILTNDSLKSMGRFRIQLLLEDNTWSTQNTIPKNSQCSTSATDWILLNLDFTIKNYGIKLIYDQKDKHHADTCFSNFTITHSVY